MTQPTHTTRHDGDSWDLASSVGATATMVAAARAAASRAPDPLIDDPYAAPLVRAVGVDLWIRYADGDLDTSVLDDESREGMQQMAANMAVRTRFFDEFFLAAAAEAGIRQAVILASGLDARGYRLAWPADTTVYEIDQPDVIAFKTKTLEDLGATPTARLRTVAVDLRDDWPAALTAAGFDRSQPTAWSAEGLLGYLPPDAQDRLLDTITALSAPGSRVAVESVPSIDAEQREKAVERMRETAEKWRDQGLDLDFANLIYLDDRHDAGDYLADRGWCLTECSLDELRARHGLPPRPLSEEDARFGEPHYLSGTLQP